MLSVQPPLTPPSESPLGLGVQPRPLARCSPGGGEGGQGREGKLKDTRRAGGVWRAGGKLGIGREVGGRLGEK